MHKVLDEAPKIIETKEAFFFFASYSDHPFLASSNLYDYVCEGGPPVVATGVQSGTGIPKSTTQLVHTWYTL